MRAPVSRRARRGVILIVIMTLLAGCTRNPSGGRLGPIERLNTEPGTLGLFSFPYYTAIHALDGGGAIAVWMRREGGFKPLVYRRTPSPAAAFEPERYLSPETLRETISIVPTVVGDGGKLYAVWQARQPVSGSKFVVFSRSDDDGATWLDGRPINLKTGAFVPAIATDPDAGIYVAWTDERAGRRNVYFNRSLDGGLTWLPEDVRIGGARKTRTGAISAAIASDGAGRILVVWDEAARGGRMIAAAASADRGMSWKAPVQVDDAGGGPAPSTPSVVFVAGRAVVTWTAGSVAMSKGIVSVGQVWADESTDGGTSWGSDRLLHELKEGTTPSVQLSSDGSRARVLFDAGPATGKTQIYLIDTAANGSWRNVGEQATRVSSGEGSFARPRLAADRSGALYAVWEDRGKRILLNRSIDGGATWGPIEDVVYDVGQDKGSVAYYPQVAVADGVAYVMWEVWADAADTFKTFADVERKTQPADLYVRRVTYPARNSANERMP